MSLIPAIAAELPLEPTWIVADIGSGTGLSTEPFLDNGNSVLAVEPNAAMRLAAEDLLGHRPGFGSVTGRAENTGIRTARVDLVVSGQAFHWFEPAETRAEWTRILRTPRWIALFWNSFPNEGGDFLQGYMTILSRYGTGAGGVRHGSDPADFFGGPSVQRTLPNAQAVSREALRGRALSSSYAPSPGHPDHEPMLDALDDLFAKCETEGRVSILYETTVLIGRLS